ncbi:hypothetical protein [Undibacterium oligocarboniphilum]|uniref:Uncharacterized protein n=2 Tax=Undibacterium oligocarboniphilum TaxID=666702 RepID=A0A850QGP2_9BURK|nr:hypothetical protein [Undibacterium oligocarboniphilum]MBC3868615.1 hypothetical protein [Undibacterium oligocarboniphilum]NVO76595.1 hypothetical protein [Undibacterium oligocarboniphilum]
MKTMRFVVLATTFVLAMPALADDTHHPATVAPPAVTNQKTSLSAGTDKMREMEQQMKAMQAMHEKMASATTPEERQALMVEHRKVMQEGMAMMKRMEGMSGMPDMASMPAKKTKDMSMNMADHHKMMEKRMEMMESMMQMMMDQMPATPAK